MNLKALLEKRNELKSQAKELLDNVANEVRAISVEEKTKFEELCEEVRQLDETIELLEKRQEEETVETVKIENREEEIPMEKELTVMEKELRALDQFIRKQEGEELREMTTTSTGNIIPTHLYGEVIEALNEVAPIFAEVPKLTPVGGTLEILKEKTLGQAAFVGEADSLTPSDFDFDKVKLEQRRAGSAVALTQKLINDSGIDVVAYAKSVLYKRLGVALDKAMIDGTVAAESFEGLYSAPASCEVETATAQVTSIDDYINTLNHMHPSLQADAKWIIARDEFNKLALLKDAVGNYYLNRDVIDGKPAYRLLGCEIIISEHMDAATKPAILVNLKEAYSGMIKKDMELKQINADTQNALKGTNTLVLDMYADVRIVRPEAIRVVKIKAE